MDLFFNRHAQWLNLIGCRLFAAVLSVLATAEAGRSQPSIAPESNGTGTIVSPNGDRYDISGGQRSRDGANLFHSFQRFGLNSSEIANFLSNPAIRNILGRVVSGDPSYINGLIQVTGGNSNLFLMNPAGIVFGSSASLNVPASFTAATANGIWVGNGEWFSAIGSNNYANLIGDPGAFAFAGLQVGAIVNAGNLAVGQGQSLTLLGGTVINTGTLSAPGGQITIAAVPGENLVRLSQQNNLLSLEFSSLPLSPHLPISPASSTLPQLLTGGNLSNATGLTLNPDGTIQLTGSQTQIPTAPGTTIVSGQLSVTSPTPHTPHPTPSITVLGDRVGLLNATLDASGVNGGTIRVGGDYQSKDTLPAASRTFVSQDSTITANGLSSPTLHSPLPTPSDGGRVIVWSNEATRFYGTINAQAGNGDGGFVEVSGQQFLDFQGRVNTLAPNGKPGTLLLDPTNIQVVAGANNPAELAANNQFGDPGANNTINNGTINAATTNVILQATNNIDVTAPIAISTPGIGLTAQAGNNLNVNANITTNSGDVTLTADADNSGAGALIVTNAAIATNGGNIIGSGNGDPTVAGSDGIQLNNGDLNAGGGNITLTGRGRNGDAFAYGMQIGNGSVVETTGNGNITLNGTGSSGGGFNRGVGLDGGGAVVRAVNGAIEITGVGGNGGNNNEGILLATGAVVETLGTGKVIFNGSGGNGVFGNRGIRSDGGTNPASIRSTSGDITLTGVGGSGVDRENHGIFLGLDGGAVIESLGSGDIALIGTAGNGTNNNNGIQIDNSRITSVTGTTRLLGTGNGVGTENYGVSIVAGGLVESIGSGNVVLQGTPSSTGIAPNDGIFLDNSTVQVSSGSATLVADEISLTGTTQVRGAGTLQLQPLTSGLGITVGGNLTDAQLNLNTAEFNALQPGFTQVIVGNGTGTIALTGDATTNNSLTLRSDIINYTSGTLTGTGAGAIALQANQITTGNIVNPGQEIRLISDRDLSTGTLNSSSTIGSGGAIFLSSNSSILTGDLNTAGVANGGSITLLARDNITAGRLNTSGSTGTGGNVFIDPSGDTQVSFINAQGGARGGTVDITTGNFFRATDSFVDRNGTNASISTAGSVGGAITIRHGGGVITPFVVGDATVNGVQAALTTGITNIIQPFQSFRGSYVQGTQPSQIRILTTDAQGFDVLQQRLAIAPDPILFEFDSTIALDPFLTALEENFTNDYTNHLNLPTRLTTKSLTEIRSTLRTIEQITGVRSALIYINFISSSPATTATGKKSLQETETLWQFSQGIAADSQRERFAPVGQAGDRLELVLVTTTGSVIRKFPGVTRSQVLPVVNEFQRTVTDLSDSRGYRVSAQRLYQWLITPLEADLKAQAIQTLVFIPDANLRSLPFAALLNGDKFLIESYSVGLMPSFSLTDVRYVNLKDVKALAMGASRFIDLEALPGVPTELSLITQQWQGQPFLNELFTPENLRSQRQQNRSGIIHLATHAEFRPGQLDQSFIQFWGTNRLQLNQLQQIKFDDPPAELLTLSACQTALGDREAELGFAGLAAQAGVKSVLASLWTVSDEGTLGLMTEFYRQLKDSSIKAEALRKAQVALLKGEVRLQKGQLVWSDGAINVSPELASLGNLNLSHPYYWAAFTLIGNPW